jgi:hypothetical protein
MLRHVTWIASRNGIRGFTAEVRGDNHAMLHVFHKSGLPVSSSLNDGTFSLRMPFDAEAGERPRTAEAPPEPHI